MTNVIPEVTTEVLQAFADAWIRHDVDALMSFLGKPFGGMGHMNKRKDEDRT